MTQDPGNLLDENFSAFKTERRRKLLPWWMKIFIWIFLMMGGFAFLGLIMGLGGMHFHISLYDLSTDNPLSAIGITLILAMVFKGFTSYGLWTEKDWAITIGMTDATIGILICLFRMVVYPFFMNKPDFTFNFELILLIPYLIKLFLMQKEWKERGISQTQ